MTATEFLEWTEALDDNQRYELLAGEPVAMSPERNRHNLVKMSCWRALDNAVRKAGLDCTVLGDGASVVVSDEDVYEPDVTVQCGEAIDLDATSVPYPTIVVEVLSPSTKGIDAGGKLYGYFQLASVLHYVMIDPAKQVIIHHYRVDDAVRTALIKDGMIEIDPPGIEIAVADCFAAIRD